MARLVMKFGGTSVASIKHMENVAAKVRTEKLAGNEVVVVVSAMGDETDRLVSLAEEAQVPEVDTRRELDVLLSTGEQVSIALVAMVLSRSGLPAKSFTGAQVAIKTDGVHNRSRILEIDAERLEADLGKGIVPVVAGFQGVNESSDITTLGRGGSDTTAVALAARLKADECRIYTDVEGVFTTDPRIVETARCLERITFEEMLELASLGSKVLHTRAVELASKFHVPLRVLSSFNDSTGTLITREENITMEAPLISGIAFTKNEAKLTLLGVPDLPGIASTILGPISAANIEVDMIVQNVSADRSTDFTFTLSRQDYDQAAVILEAIAASMGAREVTGDTSIAKLSIVGVGMRSHAGVASKMFEVLAAESINIQMISTSEIAISVVIDEKYLELAARALHSEFDLAEPFA
ncbi:MAG: aspartate kinase [Gammaproteobacteria bacterium]|jgi:aspartate kinase|nr:aspartate kinase [Gammaproteobacteria bacterium]MBT5203223.1 aspartate kinase [Gammaproteobacteria bacterium]MBT5602964.1 aspartate kinase [Gammaproteobacteria bacterium]MBT6245381.1 aspartate kinase [Gammaproteobacteria bacterium]